MCGIVGLFLKDARLEPELGRLVADMLATLSDRGPDSAGIAVYGEGRDGHSRITVRAEDTRLLDGLPERLASMLGGAPVTGERRDTHIVLGVADADVAAAQAALHAMDGIDVFACGRRIALYKEVGLPRRVLDRFGIAGMAGSHAIGHTRMATESAVTTCGAHPFSTGRDQCLVHNGSLSNHTALRRELVREGVRVRDRQRHRGGRWLLVVADAAGESLGEALEAALDDLDGFYTFVVGTETGFGVLRDPVACKPAVMAETDALRRVRLGVSGRWRDCPASRDARVFEPAPARVYFWDRATAPLRELVDPDYDLAARLRELNAGAAPAARRHQRDALAGRQPGRRARGRGRAGCAGDGRGGGPCRLLLRRDEPAGERGGARQRRRGRGGEHDVRPGARHRRRQRLGRGDGVGRAAASSTATPPRAAASR